MLFILAACSSVELDITSDTAEYDPWPACYAVCETIWTPAPECAEVPIICDGYENCHSVESCQEECARAVVPMDTDDGDLWVHIWGEGMPGRIADYGCWEAGRQFGVSPCDYSDELCLPAE